MLRPLRGHKFDRRIAGSYCLDILLEHRTPRRTHDSSSLRVLFREPLKAIRTQYRADRFTSRLLKNNLQAPEKAIVRLCGNPLSIARTKYGGFFQHPVRAGKRNSVAIETFPEDSNVMRLVSVGTLLLLSLSFFLQNQEQEVTLTIPSGPRFSLQPPSISLSSPHSPSAFFRVRLLLFPAWVRRRIEIRRKTKSLAGSGGKVRLRTPSTIGR